MPDQNYLTPAETAQTLVETAINKAKLTWSKILVLGMLAGAYIGFGAQLAATVATGTEAVLGYGLTKLVMGAVFSLGLILVLVGGAELFTGNSLIALAYFNKKVKVNKLLRNWLLVYLANFLGAIFLAYLVHKAALNSHGSELTAVGETMVKIAKSKASLTSEVIFYRAILANWVVCLAVWLAVAARDVVSKISACFFPVMAFVAMSFEHSIANMYFFAAAIFASSGQTTTLTWTQAWDNLIPATLGNLVGGVVFVALAYYWAYLKKEK